MQQNNEESRVEQKKQIAVVWNSYSGENTSIVWPYVQNPVWQAL